MDEGSTPLLLRGMFGISSLTIALLGLAAALMKGAGAIAAAGAQARLAGEAGTELRLDVLEGLLTYHPLRHPRQADHGRSAEGSLVRIASTAKGVSALTTHVREVELALGEGVLGSLRASGELAPLAVLLVVLDARLACGALAVLAPFGLVLGRVRRSWKRAHRYATNDKEALLFAADEAVRHADLWMTYGAEGKIIRHVRELGAVLVRRASALAASAAAISAANEVLGAAALVLVLLVVRAVGLSGAERSVLVPFAVVFFLAYKPLRDLADARLALLRGETALEALSPTLEHAPSTAHEPRGGAPTRRGAPHPGIWGLARLEISDVVTAHGAQKPICFDVAPGEIVGVRGATGAGKTSLLRAMLGLDELSSGSLRYAGAPLVGGVGPSSRPFAWVPQDAPLLAGTLASNVTLAAPDADVGALFGELGASELAARLGDGPLGPGGRGLSGGERQWVALARALATAQPVLLLDEPTSGLDDDSQARVLEAIARLRGRRSVLLVTHRPEPLRICDRVVELR